MRPYYVDDFVTIYHGDCRLDREWVGADVLLTDPPYGMAYQFVDDRPWKEKRWGGVSIEGDADTTVRDAALRMWTHGGTRRKPGLVFGRWSCPHPEEARLALTWDKGDWPGMGALGLPWGPSTENIYVLGDGFVGRRAGSVIRVNRLVGHMAHPNEKPVGLLVRLLQKCPLGVVADPFMGSGSTLVAAKQLQRRAIGVELDERYCEIAAKRLSQETLGLESAAS